MKSLHSPPPAQIASVKVSFVSLFMILAMMQGWAQEKEKEEAIEDILSKVTIDTIQIKATPYEKVLVNSVWKDEEKQINYYNDITIKTICLQVNAADSR